MAVSWNVVGAFAVAVLIGVATVLRLGGVVVEDAGVPDGMVRTGKVCETCACGRPCVSVAVTVTLVCVPVVAPAALMWTTPLGLVVESVDEVISTAPSGVVPEVPPTATFDISARTFWPATS